MRAFGEVAPRRLHAGHVSILLGIASLIALSVSAYASFAGFRETGWFPDPGTAPSSWSQVAAALLWINKLLAILGLGLALHATLRKQRRRVLIVAWLVNGLAFLVWPFTYVAF